MLGKGIGLGPIVANLGRFNRRSAHKQIQEYNNIYIYIYGFATTMEIT